jgi:hypothetical protein
LVRKTGGTKRALMVEYQGVAVSGDFVVDLIPPDMATDAAHPAAAQRGEVVRTDGVQITEPIAVR